MKPLRLVLVVRHFWPILDGPARLTAELAAGLARRGFPVTILTARWYESWPAEIFFRGVPVMRIGPAPRGGWQTVRYLHALASWLRRRRGQFDLVCVSGATLEAFAAALGLRGSRPLVIRVERAGRAGDCYWQEHSSCGPHVKRRCAEATVLVAPWPGVVSELLARGYCGERIRMIPNGVAIPSESDNSQKTAARAVLTQLYPPAQMPPWAPLAVYVGRLDCRRGLSTLLQAWRLLAGRWPDARLWLVGAGPDHHHIQQTVHTLALDGRVHLLGAFDCVDQPLAAADVFVWPDPEFGTGAAIMEAMAAGLPVVAVDAEPVRTFIGQDIAGVLAAGQNAQAFALAIDRLFGAPQLASRLGAAGRRRVEQQYSAAKMVEEHSKLFETLVPQ